MNNLKEIIQKLELKPHPEGGYYKETYRSTGELSESELGSNYQGSRNYSTSIYFLLTSNDFSAFHRIQQDEIWHFYMGSPILLHTISEKGIHSKFTIGNNLLKGELPQLVVPGGHWFGAEVMDKDAFALVGCTVAPGFDFKDFDLPTRQDLIDIFPKHEQIISKLSHN